MESSAVFYGLMGAGSALALSCAGAAFGTAKAANFRTQNDRQTINVQDFVTSENSQPGLFISTIPIIIAGVLAIYGLIYSVIVLAAVPAEDYSDSRGYAQFVGGITVGLCCLASGLAVGMVGNRGLRALTENKSSPLQVIINLVYCEALGLYGLIFGLIAASCF